MATYIGVALYIILYGGYTIYEKIILRRKLHFVPSQEVDFITDAVWAPGEGNLIKEEERRRREERVLGESQSGLRKLKAWTRRRLY